MAQSPDDLSDAKVTAVCLSPVPTDVPFPCVVEVLGVGDPAPPLVVEVRLPPGLLHIGHDGAGRFDADHRSLTFPVSRQAGAPRASHFELIADRATTGFESTVDVEMRIDGRLDHSEWHTAVDVDLDRPSQLDLGYAVLPVSPVWPFLAMVLCIPVCLGLVWMLRRGRRALTRAPRRPGYPPVPRDTVMAPAFFSLLCLLALALLSPAVVESARSLTAFTETRCTILDRTERRSSTDEGNPTSTAVLRYATPAGSRIAIGFDVRGTGGGVANAAAHRAFAVGRDYPCWMDPRRPDRVVLRRGVSGSAWLALVPALALLRLLPALWRAWRS